MHRWEDACMLPQAPDAPLTRKPLRVLWLLAGFASLGLGVVGIVTPLLPTVPLVLLAAWCFSKGSVRWETWLLAHPRFGPMVRDWRANHAVPRRAKWAAGLMMTLSCAIAWWQAPWWAALLATLICSAVLLWLWRLPEP